MITKNDPVANIIFKFYFKNITCTPTKNQPKIRHICWLVALTIKANIVAIAKN